MFIRITDGEYMYELCGAKMRGNRIIAPFEVEYWRKKDRGI